MSTSRRLLGSILALAVAVITVAMPWRASIAYACSAGSDWDPIAESEVIVGGWITGWTEVGKPVDRPSSWPFSTVNVQMDVDRVFKGSASPFIAFTDSASYSPGHGGSYLPGWNGSGGSCGAFNEDPTGSYAVMGLHKADNGTLNSNLLTTFYIGDAPAGEHYVDALQRLKSLGVTGLPVTGSGPALSDESGLSETTLVVPGVIVVSLLAARALAQRGNTQR